MSVKPPSPKVVERTCSAAREQLWDLWTTQQGFDYGAVFTAGWAPQARR